VMLAILFAGWYEHNLGDGEILTLFLAICACGYVARALPRVIPSVPSITLDST